MTGGAHTTRTLTVGLVGAAQETTILAGHLLRSATVRITGRGTEEAVISVTVVLTRGSTTRALTVTRAVTTMCTVGLVLELIACGGLHTLLAVVTRTLPCPWRTRVTERLRVADRGIGLRTSIRTSRCGRPRTRRGTSVETASTTTLLTGGIKLTAEGAVTTVRITTIEAVALAVLALHPAVLTSRAAVSTIITQVTIIVSRAIVEAEVCIVSVGLAVLLTGARAWATTIETGTDAVTVFTSVTSVLTSCRRNTPVATVVTVSVVTEVLTAGTPLTTIVTVGRTLCTRSHIAGEDTLLTTWTGGARHSTVLTVANIGVGTVTEVITMTTIASTVITVTSVGAVGWGLATTCVATTRLADKLAVVTHVGVVVSAAVAITPRCVVVVGGAVVRTLTGPPGSAVATSLREGGTGRVTGKFLSLVVPGVVGRVVTLTQRTGGAVLSRVGTRQALAVVATIGSNPNSRTHFLSIA